MYFPQNQTISSLYQSKDTYKLGSQHTHKRYGKRKTKIYQSSVSAFLTFAEAKVVVLLWFRGI